MDALQCCQIVNVILMDLLCLSDGGVMVFSPDRDQKEFGRPKLEIYSQRMGSVSELFYRIIITSNSIYFE